MRFAEHGLCQVEEADFSRYSLEVRSCGQIWVRLVRAQFQSSHLDDFRHSMALESHTLHFLVHGSKATIWHTWDLCVWNLTQQFLQLSLAVWPIFQIRSCWDMDMGQRAFRRCLDDITTMKAGSVGKSSRHPRPSRCQATDVTHWWQASCTVLYQSMLGLILKICIIAPWLQEGLTQK